MAEIILAAVLPVLFDKLASAALNKMARSQGIQAQLKKWESLLPKIQAVLLDAAQKEIADEPVQLWLDGLRHLAYDMDDVLDDLATKAMHTEESRASTSKVTKLIPTCCTGFSLSCRMKNKINDISTRLQDLAERKNTLRLIEKEGKSKNMNRTVETSLVDVSSIVGRHGDKEELLQKLLGDEQCVQNFSILPIVGMGGIGKTTLARLLYNEARGKDRFELKAWVCVSDEFNVFKMSEIIFQSVTKENKEFKDLNLLQEALREQLAEKRFLLVLDDVWSESCKDWDILVRPFHAGAPGSKIIMTTRKQQLLKQLGYDHPHHLQSLSDDDALSLFSQHALGVNNFDSHPTLRPHGEGIVKKCNGLPLALIALGRLLRTKTDEEEWKDLLNSEIWQLQEGNEILPALRLSYHDLPARLKQLFAYCSLFPKDYVFDKEELILLWMAEGFLHQLTTNKSTEHMGHECFEQLLSRSFFIRAPNEESLYVMHDLMNDLATFVARDFFFRLDNDKDKDDRKEALEKYRHMSFVRQQYDAYGKFKVFERAKNLRTFLSLSVGVTESWQSFYLSNKVLVDLLPELPLLRVLCLSDYQISEVPESIGSLKHLRYLNLSRTNITYLPENIGDLYNLQTLLICGCRELNKLPNNFSKLKNLRHLDISRTPKLKKLPRGIGELKCLQTLTKVIIEGANGFAITELKDMKDLNGRISIKGLDKVTSAMDGKNANLSHKSLNELEMKWSNVFDVSRNETLEMEVLNVLNPHNDRLRKLEIAWYGGIEFPSWVGCPSFKLLAHVKIHGCKKCTSLPPLGKLPLLKKLFVSDMDGVKFVGSELVGTSLELLSFSNMSGWEEWSTNNIEGTSKVFPCLRKLSIKSCPQLVEVSLETLPSLRELEIDGCGDVVLRSLVHAASKVTTLEMVYISGLTQLDGGVIEDLRAVEEITIRWCSELRYLLESEAEAGKILVNLRRLDVRYCDNLVSLGEREEDNCWSSLTSLREVWIHGCSKLEHYSCQDSIETLRIGGCDSISSLSFPTGGQKLKRLDISHCKKLMEDEELGGGGEKSRSSNSNSNSNSNRVLLHSTMSSLEDIYISKWSNLKLFPDLRCFLHLTSLEINGCKNLESFPNNQLSALTSLTRLIIEYCPSMVSFPNNQLSALTSLTRLSIEYCPSMVSFPDHELPNLTSLTSLYITNCQSMDDSFTSGLWPPKLQLLEIGGLKKPISQWGPQNFPTSLSFLSLLGGPSEDVSSCSGLSHLLPSSLTKLDLNDFGHLESVSMGLQHLTSLQHLWIVNCPKTRDLPESLLPLLLSLFIGGCPKLEEMYGRRGSRWPLISGIPWVTII